MSVADIPQFPMDKFTHVFQFADDTAKVGICWNAISAQEKIERKLKVFKDYADRWKISINTEKQRQYFLDEKPQYIPLFKWKESRVPTTAKYLGVTIDRRFTFQHHVKKEEPWLRRDVNNYTHCSNYHSIQSTLIRTSF